MIVVVKVGSSSVSAETVQRLGREVAAARDDGHVVVVVTSGAISAGWDALAGANDARRTRRCSRPCRPSANTA